MALKRKFSVYLVPVASTSYSRRLLWFTVSDMFGFAILVEGSLKILQLSEASHAPLAAMCVLEFQKQMIWEMVTRVICCQIFINGKWKRCIACGAELADLAIEEPRLKNFACVYIIPCVFLSTLLFFSSCLAGTHRYAVHRVKQ